MQVNHVDHINPNSSRFRAPKPSSKPADSSGKGLLVAAGLGALAIPAVIGGGSIGIVGGGIALGVGLTEQLLIGAGAGALVHKAFSKKSKPSTKAKVQVTTNVTEPKKTYNASHQIDV